jgi:hypothetical protein
LLSDPASESTRTCRIRMSWESPSVLLDDLAALAHFLGVLPIRSHGGKSRHWPDSAPKPFVTPAIPQGPAILANYVVLSREDAGIDCLTARIVFLVPIECMQNRISEFRYRMLMAQRPQICRVDMQCIVGIESYIGRAITLGSGSR